MKEQFEKIPGYSKYEATGIYIDKLIIRSIKDKIVQNKRSDTGKYQLKNDDGSRPQITEEFIYNLFPKKENTYTKDNLFEKYINPFDRDDIKRIMNEYEFNKSDKVYRLKLIGLSDQEISEITESSIGFIRTCLSQYKTGDKKGIKGDKIISKKEESKKVISKEEPQKKGLKHIPNPKDSSLLKEDAKKIMQSKDTNYNKVIALFNSGYNKFEIIEITGSRNDVISKYLRPFIKK